MITSCYVFKEKQKSIVIKDCVQCFTYLHKIWSVTNLYKCLAIHRSFKLFPSCTKVKTASADRMNVFLLSLTLINQTPSLICLLRQDPKAKDWLHTKARRGALVNTSALSAKGSGWVETPGPTWDRNASNAISMFILINRYGICLLTAHIMWYCIAKTLHAGFSNLSVKWVSTYGVNFQEVLMDGAQQVPLKPETQTQGIRLTQIPLELKKGSFFRKSLNTEFN